MVREDNILAALVDEFTELAAESNALDDDGFCNWYLRVVNQCDGAEAKITEMAKSMLKEVENRRKALAFVHGREFERRVLEKLQAQGGKSKTVKFLLGKAGQRKVATQVEFVPELHAQTVSWASANLDDVWVGSITKTPALLKAISTLAPNDYAEAVGSMLKTPFKDHMESTGEIPPGIDITPEHEGFHVNGKVLDLGHLIETVRAELEPALDAPVTFDAAARKAHHAVTGE